jgi:cytidylate kinase
MYRVVCISGTEGAGAAAVSEIVADRLGFLLIDEGIIYRAAREAGLEPHVVAEAELRKSFLKRLVLELRSGSGIAADAGALMTLASGEIPEDDLRGLIRSAIEETAAGGDVVIASHAASVALAGRDDTLRVLVTASPDTRRDRLAAARGLTAKEAAKEVARSDARRADYLRRFYGVDDEQPTLYDVVLSSDRLAPEAVAEVVAELATS